MVEALPDEVNQKTAQQTDNHNEIQKLGRTLSNVTMHTWPHGWSHAAAAPRLRRKNPQLDATARTGSSRDERLHPTSRQCAEHVVGRDLLRRVERKERAPATEQKHRVYRRIPTEPRQIHTTLTSRKTVRVHETDYPRATTRARMTHRCTEPQNITVESVDYEGRAAKHAHAPERMWRHAVPLLQACQQVARRRAAWPYQHLRGATRRVGCGEAPMGYQAGI